MWSFFFLLACTISIPTPDPSSREAEVRLALQRINQLASEMEHTALELESYTDEMRRTPQDNAVHLTALRAHLKQLQLQRARLEQEIKDWQTNLKADAESIP